MNRRRDDDYEDRRSSRGDNRSRGYHSDQDDRRGRQIPDRDEYGHFMSDDDDDRRHRSGWGSSAPYRDDYQDDDWNEDDDDDRRDSRGRRGSTGQQGFAGMDPEEQREIARRGGQASARMQSRDEYGQFEGRSGSQSRGRVGYYDESEDGRPYRESSGQRGYSRDSGRGWGSGFRDGRSSSHSR